MQISVETLNILFLMMPGFIASRVLDAIITRRDAGVAAKFIEALIFAFMIYAIASFFFEWSPLVVATDSNYQFSSDYGLVAFVLAASVIVPVIVGACMYHDLHTGLLRKLWITDKTSRFSVWQDVMSEQKRHVVVHLDGGLRVYGWPMYFAHDPKDSYLYLFQPAWVSKKGQYIETGTHGILIRNDAIRAMEFMKHPREDLKAIAKEVV